MSDLNNEGHKPAEVRGKPHSARLERPGLVAGIQALRDRRRSRLVLTLILTIMVGAIVSAPVLSYNGFCFSQGRFLSDQEYVNIAISRIMSLPCYQLMNPTFQCVPPIPYKDAADFRARNPDCCRFVRHNSDFAGSGIVTFSQQVFGYAARSVLVNFKISYVEADGRPTDTTGHGLIVVGNCGDVLNRGH